MQSENDRDQEAPTPEESSDETGNEESQETDSEEQDSEATKRSKTEPDKGVDRVPALPMDVLVAQTEGSLGYFLQQALLNELRRRDVQRYVVTMVTQVLVDENDPAFASPSKPVGPFFTEEDAE